MCSSLWSFKFALQDISRESILGLSGGKTGTKQFLLLGSDSPTTTATTLILYVEEA